jgi:hypothetical protein
MRPDPDEETEVSLHDLSPDDRFAVLVAEMLKFLCVEQDYSLLQARRIVASAMGGLYPHVAFPSLPVAARMQ